MCRDDHPGWPEPRVAFRARREGDVAWQFSASRAAQRPSDGRRFATVILMGKDDDFGWPYCYHSTAVSTLVLSPEYGGNGTTGGRCDGMSSRPLGTAGAGAFYRKCHGWTVSRWRLPRVSRVVESGARAAGGVPRRVRALRRWKAERQLAGQGTSPPGTRCRTDPAARFESRLLQSIIIPTSESQPAAGLFGSSTPDM